MAAGPSITTNSLGQIGRLGIQKLYYVVAADLPDYVDMVMGKRENTDEAFYRASQLAPLNPAQIVQQNSAVTFDAPKALLSQDFTPYITGKGIKFGAQIAYVDQYGVIVGLIDQVARAFQHARNQNATNLLNLGFTNTSYGMNSETLFSTSHSNGTSTLSNRPAIDVAFGPLAIAQGRAEIRIQKDPNGNPMPYTGGLFAIVPPGLEGELFAVLNTEKIIGTNNNDVSFARQRLNGDVNDYLTSTTAWFLRAEDPDAHGALWVDQMPFNLEKLPMTTALEWPWVMYESYVPFWYDAHGYWGTLGQ